MTDKPHHTTPGPAPTSKADADLALLAAVRAALAEDPQQQPVVAVRIGNYLYENGHFLTGSAATYVLEDGTIEDGADLGDGPGEALEWYNPCGPDTGLLLDLVAGTVTRHDSGVDLYDTVMAAARAADAADPIDEAGPGEDTSVDWPLMATLHVRAGRSVPATIDALDAELGDGLLLDTELPEGVVLHQLSPIPGLRPRVVPDDDTVTGAQAPEPGGTGTLFLFDTVTRTTVGVRGPDPDTARARITRALGAGVDIGQVHDGVALREMSTWLVAARPFDVDGEHRAEGDEATPVLPWETAHLDPQVTDLASAATAPVTARPGLQTYGAAELETLASALLTYARLSPCESTGATCAGHEDACERHGIALTLLDRLRAAATDGRLLPDTD